MIGQEHLIAKDKPLYLLSKKNPQSFVLWGPPGVGKTTIINIIAKSWNCELIKLSAIYSGVKEIKEAIDVAINNKNNLFSKQIVLFVDEIHRFNKTQQDTFLHHIENGDIILIGATTFNPSFELNRALLSRLQIYILKLLTENNLLELINKSLLKITTQLSITENAKKLLANLANQDARKLLNILELVINLDVKNLNEKRLKEIIPNYLQSFDKGHEEFYNQISALHKAIRGSDIDASLYWCMRMLKGGADPFYICRRLLRIALEDIGIADLNAQTIALNTLQTFERLGSPEGDLAIINCVIYLAISPKSNSSYEAYNKVNEFVEHTTSEEVPLHLRNASTTLMKNIGYGNEYKYAHNYEHHYVPNENYWPKNISKQTFYSPTKQGIEKRITERIKFLKSLDEEQFQNIKK